MLAADDLLGLLTQPQSRYARAVSKPYTQTSTLDVPRGQNTHAHCRDAVLPQMEIVFNIRDLL
jgi:hypothetical protein